MNVKFFVDTLKKDSPLESALNVLQVASFLPDHAELELRRELRRQGAR